MTTRVYTYDRAAIDGGPYVPGVDDLGGEITDDTQNPPAGDEPSEQLYNERRDNLAGLNRCTWWATIWVTYSGGYSISAIDAMGTLVEVADITATPSATGVVVLSWAAGTFPGMARTPRVWQTGAQGFAYGEVTTANSITVYLENKAGVAADRSFAVELR